jgi:hypothetical protein
LAISSSTRKAGPFLGNDATTVFPFAFKVFTSADLRVVNTSALGIESDLVLDTDYTVTLNSNQDNDPGGTVTRATALPTGQRLTITSDVEALQPLVLTNNGGFYPRVINDAFDKITIIAQQLIEQVGRSLKLPISSSASATLPDPVANSLIAWNSSANGFANVAPTAVATLAAYADAYIDLFTGNGTQTAFTLTHDPVVLANLSVSISGVVQVGGEDFTWIGNTITFVTAPPNGTRIQVRYARALPPSELAFLASSTGAAAVGAVASGTGAVLRTVEAKLRDHLHVLDFIPVAEHAAILARTSTFDCSADVAECITAASAQKKSVKFGGGRYRFLSDLAIPVGNGSAIDIFGEGKEQTQIEFFGAGSTRGIVMDGVTGYVYAGAIRDLTVFPNTGAGRAITLENLNRPKIENVNILNAPAVGIYIDTCIMPRLSHLLLNGCGSASFGAIEIDNSTTAFLDEVYISGGEAGGGTGKIGGLLVDRSVNFTMLGGAIESTGTPIKIASKSEGTIPCDGGVVLGTDLENPGNNLPYIDAGAGWTGTAALAAKSWTFINTHGFPSGTTTSVYGVKLEDTTGFRFTNCSLGQAGTPTSLYELVGAGNKGTIIEPCRALFGASTPYVRVDGVQQTAATPIVTWNPESPALIDVSKTVTGSTPSASVSSAQGGVYSKIFMNNGSATNLTNLTDGVVGAVVTLICGNGNTTIKHQAGGSGQFDNPGGTDVVMVQNQPYLYYNNTATGRWTAYASNRMTTIELGHASDTTIARVSAGDISVEGNLVYRANGALAASGGSALVGFLQSGTSATARTVQAKLRDIVNVRDFGATGDGATDDAAAIRAAIAAASGRTLYFPTPSSSYLCNSSLGTLSSVRLLGDGRRVCTIKKNYSGGSPFITMNDSSEIEGLRIDLSGNTGITGLGIYIANSQGNQRIAATQLLNGDTSCLYFQKDGGSNFTAYDLQAYCFTASNPAVEIEDVSTGGCPRSFVNFSSGGNKSFKLGGANNLFVANSPIFDVDFSANNYDVCFSNCRMAGSSGYTVRGSGSIMGGGIGPAMTIASGAAWNINPAYTNSTITDNSGGTSIIHQHNIVSYTPVWTAGGSAVTLGTGGSIVGRYSRSGKLVTAKFRILPGTSPTIPAGKWEITLPVPTAADLPQAAGTGKYTTGGGAFYRIDGYIPAAGTAVTLERDTSGEITGTSPSATGNGAGVWFQVTYET